MLGGYWKYQEGIENVRRVSQNLKTKPCVLIGIENSQRVSEILGGYRKCTKGIKKLKKLSTEFQ